MSIVNITHHDESVFDWEYKEKPKIQKSKLYRSKYRENIIKSAQINKQVDYNLIDSSRSLKSALLTSSKNNFLKRPQSLGYSKILLRAPCNFLKKDEGIHIRKIPHHKCIKSEYKPKLPNWKNQQQQQQQIPKSNGNNNNKEKNFKLQNIQNIKNIKPKGTIVPKYVDKERGDIHELRKSGIIPEYVYNKNFGKIPIYIMKRKQNYLLKSDEKIEKKDLENDQFGLNEILQINSSKLKIINPKERTEILNVSIVVYTTYLN